MDKCPACGYVEQTQQLVNSQAMNRFVRLKDGAIGVINNNADRFTVPVKTGQKDPDGNELVEQITWVKESVYLKEKEAAQAAAEQAAMAKTSTPPASVPTVPPAAKPVVPVAQEPALADVPKGIINAAPVAKPTPAPAPAPAPVQAQEAKPAVQPIQLG